MRLFIFKILVYLLCLITSLYGLQALDFNRFLKQNKAVEARVLYFILAISLTYILGQFMMSIIYYFN